MATPIDLTKPEPTSAFKVDKVNQRPILAQSQSSAMEYLQEIKLMGTSVRCCVFKDVGNPNGEEIADGDYLSYRLSMLNLPENIQYVDYNYNSTNGFKITGVRAELKASINTPVVLDLKTEATTNVVHFCSIGAGSSTGAGNLLSRRPVACYNQATSIRNSDYKPFHLFKLSKINELFIEDNQLIQRETFTGNKDTDISTYLIPISLSEGIIAYFIILEEEKTDVMATLTKFAEIVYNTKSQTGDHWCTVTELVYNDTLGIFITTKVKKDNYQGSSVPVVLPIKFSVP